MQQFTVFQQVSVQFLKFIIHSMQMKFFAISEGIYNLHACAKNETKCITKKYLIHFNPSVIPSVFIELIHVLFSSIQKLNNSEEESSLALQRIIKYPLDEGCGSFSPLRWEREAIKIAGDSLKCSNELDEMLPRKCNMQPLNCTTKFD